MSINEYGDAKNIPPVAVKCECDRFENMIREFGVEWCCEWFGHHKNSEFTKETISVLCKSSGITSPMKPCTQCGKPREDDDGLCPHCAGTWDEIARPGCGE